MYADVRFDELFNETSGGFDHTANSRMTSYLADHVSPVQTAYYLSTMSPPFSSTNESGVIASSYRAAAKKANSRTPSYIENFAASFREQRLIYTHPRGILQCSLTTTRCLCMRVRARACIRELLTNTESAKNAASSSVARHRGNALAFGKHNASLHYTCGGLT